MIWARFLAITRRVLRRRRGAAMVEYALLAALIAVVAITAVTSLGTGLRGKFSTVAATI